ncbi:MAG: TetR/AcrR family transcriptional regulator [Saprospirales bacterium]|nr:MAG: TetR/AcrR family transcriptional regulator [Saprospirales bacterium]
MKQQIIEHAGKIFFKKGVKSVTMDELCSEIGISKKTIYIHFANKEELVREVIRMFMKNTLESIYFLMEGASNSIEGYCEIADHVFELMTKISPAMIHEIRKYYPAVWGEIQEFKKMSIENMAYENLKKGVAEGVYRSDINIDLVNRFYLTVILNMNDEELFPDTTTDPASVYKAFINYHIRSIATEKGYEIFKKYNERQENQKSPKFRNVIDKIIENRKTKV